MVSTNVDTKTAVPAGVREYIAIMRLDHATKHVFILPGIVLAALLRGLPSDPSVWPFVAGLITAVCIASANYVINEFLDREFDAHHPTKSARSAVQKVMKARVVALEWAVLVAIGLAAAASSSMTMLVTALIFAGQGIVYNVSPIRSKDVPFLDVISEAINNPLRLLIGWTMVDPHTLPPSSIILAYWLGGAFLMATKRLSEYREIVASHSKNLLARYRRSFAGYSEMTLTASCLVYALLCVMMLSVFFVKYRIEYILTLVPIALLFGNYMALAMHPGSTAQKPERLFQEKGLMILSATIAIMFAILTFVDIHGLNALTAQHYITVG